MTESEIRSGVAAVALEHLGLREAFSGEARLVEDLDLDSLQLLTLAAEVENRFAIRLEPEDEATIVTVDDLVRTVAAKLAAEGR